MGVYARVSDHLHHVPDRDRIQGANPSVLLQNHVPSRICRPLWDL